MSGVAFLKAPVGSLVSTIDSSFCMCSLEDGAVFRTVVVGEIDWCQRCLRMQALFCNPNSSK
jgi:hypothetical protein